MSGRKSVLAKRIRLEGIEIEGFFKKINMVREYALVHKVEVSRNAIKETKRRGVISKEY